ncbi:uncharacterized protein LOC121795578 isoform X2 [Salvia splendens]|uniref:uncharacterized protein LOC121795578 isoform X2 n=1 Tax=Salvia splendens TaxID=180675 RepID=UPI001C26F3E6|nr:uncharacterized protein LOC121795578 isoform X2 [Salvia splendens]
MPPPVVVQPSPGGAAAAFGKRLLLPSGRGCCTEASLCVVAAAVPGSISRCRPAYTAVAAGRCRLRSAPDSAPISSPKEIFV